MKSAGFDSPCAWAPLPTTGLRVGAWRYMRPVMIEKPPPCNAACPAGQDVQGLIALLAAGHYEEAARRAVTANPLAGVCGRVCPAPCRSACNREHIDVAVLIPALERYASELARSGKVAPLAPEKQRKESIAVVGAGPAGLSAAHRLALAGYRPVIFEARSEAGGVLRYGIPPYRLPKEIVAHEVGRIVALGVEIRTGEEVRGPAGEEKLKGFDAVLLASGAGVPLRSEAEVRAPNVMSGVEFLGRVNRRAKGHSPRAEVGRRVVVVGGGDVAIDAARSALRLGAVRVTAACLETREAMPALPEGLEEALAEGVELRCGVLPERIVLEGGRAAAVDFVPAEGSDAAPERLEADTVIFAIGQRPDISFLGGLEGDLLPGRIELAGRPGWFAAGDLVGARRTVAEAVGAGARAARRIRRFLGEDIPRLPAEIVPIGFESLNPDHFDEQAPEPPPRLTAARAVAGFEEVNRGFDKAGARREAARCLSCGVCSRCGVCLTYCPDAALVEAPGRGREKIRVLLEWCKGCGMCAVECPRGVVEMEVEHK